MAFGPEFIFGLVEDLKKILPLRVNRIEGGEAWLALKTSNENWLLLSWAPRAAGICPASNGEIDALKEFSRSRASIFEALKSRLSHGGEIISVKQLNHDRILEFEAVRRISAGVSVRYFLILEITEPVANFLLLDENHKIEEAARHSTPDVNSFRTILPGHVYTAPPAFNGIEIEKSSTLKFEDIQNIKGIGRPLARLIQSNFEKRPSISWLAALNAALNNKTAVQCLLIKKNNYLTRFDFNFPETIPLGTDVLKASRHGVLIPLLEHGREKVLHLIDAKLKRVLKSKQRHRDGLLKQLKECQESEIFRKKGEAILAHIYEIPKRAEKITLSDWEGNKFEITLDPNLPPSRNAEKYFKRYRKAKGNPEEIKSNLEEVNAAIKELEEQPSMLYSAGSIENFNEAVKDLNEWIDPSAQKKKGKSAYIPPHLNIKRDGINILVGLSARGNRYVTFKTASREDIWLHAHELPGAHVIIKGATRNELENEKRDILEFAAGLAASYSAGKESGSVQIDYTERKYIRAVPGSVALVTYTNPGTIRITPLNEGN